MSELEGSCSWYCDLLHGARPVPVGQLAGVRARVACTPGNGYKTALSLRKIDYLRVHLHSSTSTGIASSAFCDKSQRNNKFCQSAHCNHFLHIGLSSRTAGLPKTWLEVPHPPPARVHSPP